VNVVTLAARNPGAYTGRGNNTFLIAGRYPTLVDAGVGHPGHLDALVEALAGADLLRVIVTHGHVDHVSGAASIAARWRPEFAKLPWPGQDEHHGVEWTAVADGQVLEAGDEELTVVHTPGHAPDHVCLLHAASGTVFAGDMVIAGSTVVIPASEGGSLADYLASLERLLALDPRRLLPAHGPAIDRPSDLIRAYLRHRREREAQIVEALGSSPASIPLIVQRVYERLPVELHGAAAESVLAHLQKLASEGVVRVEDGLWSLARGVSAL
jgi:glyoxylase-like metal-dependent hydrolase (beta-lactamase superfamily II)